MGKLDWDSVFGLSARSQRNERSKQNNVVSSEALADEMGTKVAPNSSVTPSPSEQDASESEAPEQTDGGNDSGPDTGGNPADGSQPDEESGVGGTDQPADDLNDPLGDNDGQDAGGSAGDDSVTPDDATPVDSDSTTPSGVNPNRSLNGKIRLSQEIRNLIGEMESALETFEQISLKNPVVVKLRELKDATELLLDTVASVPVEDTMVRYELTVRNFSELIKSLKTRKQ